MLRYFFIVFHYDKSEIIAEVLHHFAKYPKEQFIMIGARENDFDAIGVTYGYGSRQELEKVYCGSNQVSLNT